MASDEASAAPAEPRLAIPFDEAAAQVAGPRLPGWLGEPWESRVLYDLAADLPDESTALAPIVEIGTFCGKSTCYLAAPGRQRVYAIDPADPLLYNGTQIAVLAGREAPEVAYAAWVALGIEQRIERVQMTSAEAAEGDTIPAAIGLLFVDGCHYDEAVAADLAHYAPRVVTGGIVALHDWGVRGDEPGVRWNVAGVATAYFAQVGGWQLEQVVGSLAVWRREV